MRSNCRTNPNAGAQIVSGSPTARADSANLELLRRDVRGEIHDIMRANFVLPREEAEVFWPLYVEYEKEASVIWDNRLELIEEYNRKRLRLTEDDAQGIMNEVFELDDRMTKLRRRYFRRIKREVSSTVALRIMQLDRRINNLIEIQLAERVPLAK